MFGFFLYIYIVNSSWYNKYINIPIVKIYICFLLGILTASSFAKPMIIFILLGAIIGLIILIYSRNKSIDFEFSNALKKQIYYLLFFLFYILGITITSFYDQLSYKTHYSNFINENEKNIFAAKLLENPIEKENSYKAEVAIYSVLKEKSIIKSSGNCIIYFQKDSEIENLQINDQIYLNSFINALEKSKNRYEFDFKKYLSNKNIHYQTYVTAKDWHEISKTSASRKISINQIQIYLQETIRKYVNGEDEIGVASALLIGNRTALNEDILKAYANTGSTHVLAVSGLHVGLFYGLISILLSFIKKIKKIQYLHLILTVCFIWFYVLITGASPSVTRAASMFTMIAIGIQFKNQINIYNVIAFSALLISAYNPNIIYDVGFQLSYLAVIGIIFLQKHIYNWIYIENALLDKIWTITSVSIAAQISTFPLIIYYFHQFPIYFFISNLIVIPGAVVILYLGILLFLVSWNHFLSMITGKLLGFSILILNKSLIFLEKLPYAVIHNQYLSHFQLLVLYTCIILLSFALVYRSKQILNYFLIAFFILNITFSYTFLKTFNQKKFIVHHIPKYSAISFISGKNQYSVIDSALINNKKLMKFRLEAFFGHQHISPFNSNTFKLSKVHIDGMTVYHFNKMKIGVIDERYNTINKPIQLDYLVISKSPRIKLNKLRQQIKAKTYIFDTSNSNWDEKNWKEECKSLTLDCYFVSENKAFELENENQ